MIEHVLGVGFIVYAGFVLFDRHIDHVISDARWEMRSHDRGYMEITIKEGVGAIPVGSLLVWEHQPGGKLAMWEARPRDQYHPMTIPLTRESQRRLRSTSAQAWILEKVDGLRIEITPIPHPESVEASRRRPIDSRYESMMLAICDACGDFTEDMDDVGRPCWKFREECNGKVYEGNRLVCLECREHEEPEYAFENLDSVRAHIESHDLDLL